MHKNKMSGLNKLAILVALALLISLGFAGKSMALPIGADIIAVVDESGSMSTEHAFLQGGVMASLDSALQTAGVNANRFGLVGFGTSQHGGGSNQVGHQHNVGGGEYGTANQFATASGGLVVSGGFEDGYEAMNFALGYTDRSGNVAHQMILVSDEDRDVNSGAGINFGAMQSSLNSQRFVLNAIINANFNSTDGGTGAILGLLADGSVYRADGVGGFVHTAAGVGGVGSSAGSTNADYIQLAHNLGGAAWDLNQLRAGGLTAQSFAGAFVDAKVAEIIVVNPVPAPFTIGLLGLGLIAMGVTRRRKTMV